MADLTTVGTADLSFNNTQDWTVAANLTGSPTWCRVIIHAFDPTSHSAGSLTTMTWNGVDISGHYHANAATANRGSGILAEIPFAVGANTGSHNFHFIWSVASFIDVQLVWGTGDLDSAVVDTNGFVDSECVAVANVCTPTAYTTTTDRALPVFSVLTDGNNGTLSSGTGTTRDITSALDSGAAAFEYPLKTPAGATVGTFGNTNSGHTLVISYALKPTGGGGGSNWGPLLGQQLNRLVQG